VAKRRGGVSIREARASETARLAALYSESATYHTALEPDLYTVPQPDAMVRAFKQQLASSDMKLFVAVKGATVVGFVSVRLVQPSSVPGMLRPRTTAWFAIASVRSIAGAASAGT
jgi:hypothetical protein